MNKKCSISVIEHICLSCNSVDTQSTGLGDGQFLTNAIVRYPVSYTNMCVYVCMYGLAAVLHLSMFD